jgi:hypothetical protein
MKISTKYLYAILATSLLLNAMAGLYGVRSIFSRVSAKPEAKTINEDAKPYSSILHSDSISPDHEIRKTTILNTLIERYNYHSYLEIGQGHRDQNFDWVNCIIKIGVDPNRILNAAYQMTSDEYFALNHDAFDLIFIDGLHHADQVERDIIHALQVLKENGTIVVHDCNPSTKQMQIVPLPQGQTAWTGDGWRAWVKLRATRPDLMMVVLDTDYGLGIIRRGSQNMIDLPEPLTYEELDKNRERLLNLVDVNSFLKELKARGPSHAIPAR